MPNITLRGGPQALETFINCVQNYVDPAKVRFRDFGYETVTVCFDDTEDELDNFLALVDDCEWITVEETSHALP